MSSAKEFVLKSVFQAVAGISDMLAPDPVIRINKYDLVSPKIPKGAESLNIAFATDLHVGCPSVSLDALEGITALINDLHPDVILLGGDYLTSLKQNILLRGGEYIRPEPIAERLAALKAPLGVYSVLGNHDWRCDGPGMWRALEKNGIHVLENDAVPLSRRFWVAGLADDSTRKSSLDETFARIKNDDPVILVTHDPGTFLDRNGRPVVTLAGHLHAGQVSLPLMGAPYVSVGRAPRRYAYGHIIEDGEDMIVSSGIGTSSLPIRFGRNAQAEVVSLTIRPAIP